MHNSTKKAFTDFFDVYLKYPERPFILDVGSLDVNGSIKDLLSKECDYIGVDKISGKNVDCIVDNILPFEDNTFDCVASMSCFEHNTIFWVTFNEMVRVCKNNGLIYITVPSIGPYHPFPVDCWRFYPDSFIALAKWNGKVDLISSYNTQDEKWADLVGIFRKSS